MNTGYSNSSSQILSFGTTAQKFSSNATDVRRASPKGIKSSLK